MEELRFFNDCNIKLSSGNIHCSSVMLAKVSKVFSVCQQKSSTATSAPQQLFRGVLASRIYSGRLFAMSMFEQTAEADANKRLAIAKAQSAKRHLTCVTFQDDVQVLAPMFELAYGDIHFQLDSDNFQAAMYCHHKYDCPSLGSACQQYLEAQVRQLDAAIVIPILSSAAQFGYNDIRKACVKWAAEHLNLIME